MNRTIPVFIGLLFAIAASSAHTATVSISPPIITTPDTIVPGKKQLQFDFDILGDFGDTLVAGGSIDVTWNPFLLEGGVRPRLDIPGQDPRFRGCSADCPPFRSIQRPTLLNVSFFGRDTFGIGGLTGMHIPAGTPIGHLTLFAIGPDGTSPISISDSLRGAGFFDITGAPIDVEYVGTIATVPLPAAGWLLLSALGGILGLHWRNAKRRQLRLA